MKSEKRTTYITRDTILKLLSDDEVARVSTAESTPGLADGEEYIDLEDPDQGVRRARGVATAPMGEVLPRSAVHADTWRKISGLVAAHRAEQSAREHAR